MKSWLARGVCLLLLIAFPQNTLAQERTPRFIGLSAFAALHPNFPCDKYLEQVNRSPKPIMPVLSGTFGNDWRCVNRFIQQNAGREHAVQVHIGNGSCRRFSRCTNLDLLPHLSVHELNKRLKRRTASVMTAYRNRAALSLSKLELGPKTRLYISPELEDNFSRKALRSVLRAVVDGGISFEQLVRSPVFFGPRDRARYDERHGLFPDCWEYPRRFANNDGTLVSNADELNIFASDARSCYSAILWTADLQGTAGATKFVPPPARRFTLTQETKRLWARFLDLMETR